jgi:hypothetical protein
MIRKAHFARTFLEANLPAWLLVIPLMFVGRGNMGLLGLLAMLFPGLWGALRLALPKGTWHRQLGHMIAFCLAAGVGLSAVVVAVAVVLRWVGLQTGETNGGVATLVFIFLLPFVAFVAVRGAMALPNAIRRWGWRSFAIRTASVIVLLVALLGGGYWWASQPYAAHASFDEPRVLTATVLTNFDDSAENWSVTDPTVRLQAEEGGLHLSYTVTPTWFYTVTWQIQPGDLPRADGLRLRGRSDAATSLVVELAEAGGGKHRACADLPAGDRKTLTFTDFLPYLNARDEDGQLDWEQVEGVTFYVYLETSGSGLWLDKIEAITLNHSGETPWLEAKSEHFLIRYHASDQRAAADVQRAAEGNYERLTTVSG